MTKKATHLIVCEQFYLLAIAGPSQTHSLAGRTRCRYTCEGVQNIGVVTKLSMRVLIQRASIVGVRFSGTGESTEAVLAHGVEAGLDIGIFEDNILTPDNTTALENYLSVSEDETSPG